MQDIVIKSFNGIGDLLFVTPTLRRIKEAYSNARVVVNTNRPMLLMSNPFVDAINESRDGVFLGYPDPIHRKHPTKHHIISDFEIVRDAYGLHKMLAPELKPEIYITDRKRPKYIDGPIAVQVIHKGHWDGKKVWDGFDELSKRPGFAPIRKFSNLYELCCYLNACSGVVCAEGGISHLCKAMGVPCVVVYGGFANPEWNGYVDQINIQRHMPCSYCYGSQPCERPNNIHKLCTKMITVSEVAEATKAFHKVPLVEHHNQMRFIQDEALKWCSGYGVDIGAGNSPLPGAIPIDNATRAQSLPTDRTAYHTQMEDRSCHYVFSSHCLEHLDKPLDALVEWFRILKENGVLFLYLPHQNYVPWQPAYNGWHKFIANPMHVAQLVQAAGFQIIELTTWPDEAYSYKVIARRPMQ